MLQLLERNIDSIHQRLVLLAPPQTPLLASFSHIRIDDRGHHALKQEMQRLRGDVYLRDGAVDRGQLTPDGLHCTPEDDKSWHLLILNRFRKVSACVWYLEHDNTTSAEGLRVRHCPLARDGGWRSTLWKAVESELARARRDDLHYAEVGGWAVSEESRCTSEGLLLALAAYSLGAISGGALGMTTATVRHASSTILRRIGGARLMADGVAVPAYYDPKYKCEMELLRFDSRRPAAKYAALIDVLAKKLVGVPVMAAAPASLAVPSLPLSLLPSASAPERAVAAA